MELTNSAGPKHQAHRLNRLIQITLITGLVISMVLMGIGALLYFFHNTTGGATGIASSAILPGMASGNPLAFMVLGMIVLMVTPALRVAVAAVGYVLEGDWTFALVSAGVVMILTTSVLIGAA